MDQLELLAYAGQELRGVVAGLGDPEMDLATNCPPWTVRRLASHALNNQLLWAGLVTGQAIVTLDDTMGGVPHDGDLAAFADDATGRAVTLWSTDGVLAATHATPFGELPGTVVVNFPTIDALAHAWDLSSSVGRAIEFAPSAMPTITALVEATCTDAVRATGLIKDQADVPADASDTERLMAAAGRTIPR